MHNKTTKVQAKVGFTMAGRIQLSVIDSASGEVVRTYPEQKNLILNQGMNMIVNRNLVDCFTHAVAGTGTTPTVDDSGASTISQTTTTVTISGGAFTFTDTATDAGKMIKWDTGEEARIVTVSSASVAVVANSATVAGAEFKVYRTNQIGLATETKRTSTYLTGSGNCGSTWASNVVSHKRTFDFTTEVGSVSYTEIGLSYTASVSTNLFSRILLSSAVNLVAGQALRLVYTLAVTWEPDTATTISVAPITGWAGSTGVAQIQKRVMMEIATTGATGSGSATQSVVGEPWTVSSVGLTSVIVIYSSSTAHNAFGSDGPTRTLATGYPGLLTPSLSTYTALDFYREKYYTIPVGSYNGSDLRTIALNESNDAGSNNGFVYIMDSAQTKDNLHTLLLTFRITWGRTLA